MASAYGRG
ncbi:mgtC family protein, partial [Yersinia pestis PY-08]